MPTNKKTTPSLVQEAPQQQVVLTGEAAKIWDEIKDREIEMFALPGQTVKDHVTPFPVTPDKLFCTIRSTAVLPSLEVACGKDYVVETADKYVMVSRAVVVPVAPLTPRR